MCVASAHTGIIPTTMKNEMRSHQASQRTSQASGPHPQTKKDHAQYPTVGSAMPLRKASAAVAMPNARASPTEAFRGTPRMRRAGRTMARPTVPKNPLITPRCRRSSHGMTPGSVSASARPSAGNSTMASMSIAASHCSQLNERGDR